MIVQVVVDVSNDSVDRSFDYIAENAVVGSRVLVPFGNRKLFGIVTGVSDSTTVDVNKLKSIIKIVENYAVISQEFLLLSDYMSEHFFLRKNDVFKLMLPSTMRNDNIVPKTKTLVSINPLYSLEEAVILIGNKAKKQLELLNYMQGVGECELGKIVDIFGRAVIDGCVNKDILVKRIIEVNRVSFDTAAIKKPILNAEQQVCVNTILSKPNTYLLHGVTGSGKTEVYLNIIEKMLAEGKTAIMLVPEISLTPLMLSRFSGRFGDRVAIIHSGLSPNEKYEQWERLRSGNASIALGARSAVFAPLNNLGVIIIDEEHDGSYTSENNPRYETSEVAEFRARYNNCSLILGSATPKINSYLKAENGEYTLLKLEKRAMATRLPNIEIVDMIGQMLDGNTSCFSTPLIAGLKRCMSEGKQAMLFVNRRGYASFMMCRECGYIAKCSDCEVALVYHREEEQLKCHYCGKKYYALTSCPNCNSKYIRYGATGTQKVVEELKNLFLEVQIFRMDNDTTRTKDSHKKILAAFGQTSPAILVGTQMIAKGHDFQNVDVVGIIDADVSLYTNDYRATETTFQLVTQVAGRAGRQSNDGKVFLQTYAAKHYVYRLARNYDYEKFYKQEINIRQTTMFPPFANLLRILITADDDDVAKNMTKSLLTPLMELKSKFSTQIYALQAMPAPIKRIERKYRYQIVIRYALDEKITCEIHSICDIMPKEKVSIFIENDPKNMR